MTWTTRSISTPPWTPSSSAGVGAAAGTVAGWPHSDPVIGLAISAAIVNVIRRAAGHIDRRLMDHADAALVDRVEHQLHQVDAVRGIDRVRVRWVGHQLHDEADVVLDPRLDLTRAYDIPENARRRLFHTVARLADALLHANPTSETPVPHIATRHDLPPSQPTP